jgi:diguanylate cyclase (GGDEF)-like protein
LKRTLKRPADLAARYGGEEFVFLLPDTRLEGAIAVAAEMEASIRALGIDHADSCTAPVVTVSLGVAAIQPCAEESSEMLVQLADAQLYRAKQLGRGRWLAESRVDERRFL